MREEDWNYKVYKKAKKNFDKAQRRMQRNVAREKFLEDKKSFLRAAIQVFGFGGWMFLFMFAVAILHALVF